MRPQLKKQAAIRIEFSNYLAEAPDERKNATEVAIEQLVENQFPEWELDNWFSIDSLTEFCGFNPDLYGKEVQVDFLQHLKKLPTKWHKALALCFHVNIWAKEWGVTMHLPGVGEIEVGYHFYDLKDSMLAYMGKHLSEMREVGIFGYQKSGIIYFQMEGGGQVSFHSPYSGMEIWGLYPEGDIPWINRSNGDEFPLPGDHEGINLLWMTRAEYALRQGFPTESVNRLCWEYRDYMSQEMLYYEKD